ncbi:hypothetical protein HanXRQr2_Chr15g0700791 [Helianthus annuus]|uniref:Uncharacterized protein n=1 Tax=Helianthus annuus TaxID=4232 RepID=A0A9K3E1N0_HELAN|nr:uncharacterized protein LOC110909896 [Helianthus annuus]KAF5765185.1 hypothetical protein HanXRQr2_Chr15g0700791 [Helianthus annuus]KAJ0831895.1 hypothetical protein HanPSC8_Chr15g0672451 [Helianthus annuus]
MQNMHHFVVKNNLVEGKTTKNGYGGRERNDTPVWPKPRRPRMTVPRELVKPFKCTNAHSQENLDGRSEILNMIITDKKSTEERDSLCYYTGSPPQRTGNPLIHDVHFINQVEVFSSLASLKH